MPRGGKRPNAGRKPKQHTEQSAPRVSTPAKPAIEPVSVPEGANLSPREILFIDAYCGPSHFNASDAYRRAGYTAGSEAGLRSSASQLLARPNVAEEVERRLLARRRELIASDDECLERITKRARGDIGLVLGPDDPLSQLPPDVRLTIKAVKPTEWGRAIELYDTHREDQLLLKLSGRLVEKREVKVSVLLEDILAAVNEAEVIEATAIGAALPPGKDA